MVRTQVIPNLKSAGFYTPCGPLIPPAAEICVTSRRLAWDSEQPVFCKDQILSFADSHGASAVGQALGRVSPR